MTVVTTPAVGKSSMEILLEAFVLSSLSTIGFFVAYAVALVLMLFIRWCSKDLQVMKESEQGKFGWVMVFVEFIDALPEAAMLAQIAVKQLPFASLLAALFVMNFANGFSTTFDIMATIKSKIVYATMFVVLHFSVGLLSYAISDSVYAQFGQEIQSHHRTYGDLYALYAGTCVGSLFVVCNMAFHQYTEETFSQANLGITSSKIVRKNSSTESATLSEHNFENYLSIVSKGEDAQEAHSDAKQFYFKIFQTFIILLMLYIWTVGWTVIIAAVFLFFQSDENRSILVLVGSFLEGIGGGAFLATIACTVLVKINECYDSMNISNRSYDKWKKVVASVSRTFFFIAGLLVANIIDITSS